MSTTAQTTANGSAMPARYRINWYGVRGQRAALVRSAMLGCIVSVAALRLMVLRAGVFACLSVHNTVVNQERQYIRWLYGLPITGLPNHVAAARSVGAFIAADWSLALMNDGTGATFVNAAMAIRGLGPAKATFMGALLGFSECPCIDVHMARMYGIPRQYATLKAYRAAVAQTPLAHTLDQWDAYQIVPAFANGQHDVYFKSVLAVGTAKTDAALLAAQLASAMRPAGSK